MGPDTSLDITSSVQFSIVLSSTWLLSYEHFHEHKDNMHVFHAEFDWKTVLNEEILVNQYRKWSNKRPERLLNFLGPGGGVK